MIPVPRGAAPIPSDGVSAPAGVTICRFPDRDRLMDSLADAVATRLAGAVAARGRAGFVASGGGTPGPLYDRLSRAPIDWSRIDVTLSDERWVPEGHPDSNAGMLTRRLLIDCAAAARLVPLYTGDAHAHAHAHTHAHAHAHAHTAAAAEVGARLETMPRPFDIVLLGMGADAHTASLFPGATGLAVALDPVGRFLAAPITMPATGAERMTLTLPALTAARQVFVLIAGMAKYRVLSQAMTDGPVADMPIRAILHQARAPVAVYWAP